MTLILVDYACGDYEPAQCVWWWCAKACRCRKIVSMLNAQAPMIKHNYNKELITSQLGHVETD